MPVKRLFNCLISLYATGSSVGTGGRRIVCLVTTQNSPAKFCLSSERALPFPNNTLVILYSVFSCYGNSQLKPCWKGRRLAFYQVIFLNSAWYITWVKLLASLIGCYSYLSSASQPCELQWVINTNKIIGKGYASRDFIQTWATKKIRRLTSIFNPVVKNFVNPTEIKENTTVKSQHVAGYMTTFQSRFHCPLSL